MIIDPKQASGKDMYFFMISAIVPRPIAFVSTKSAAGKTNLAPFSFFQGITSKPPLISVCIGHRRWDGKMVKKDSLRNIEETGEFVVNIVPEHLAPQVTQASAEYPPDVSEITETGLTPITSDVVKPPRIKECPINLECKLERVLMLGDPPLTGMVIGEVVRIHVDESVWDAEGKVVDPEKLRPLSRLGGELYGKTREIFSLPRPDWQAKGVTPKK